MNGTKTEARLLWPGLAGFYASVGDIAYTLVRVVVGAMFLMHVSGKFKIGAGAVAANIMAKNGLEPALTLAYLIMALELVGGICLVVGLFTRFFGAALAIEMLVALLAVHLPKGYAAGGGGYEYVLLIGAVCFLVALHGGGPYSVDRMIGKEL
jgi:putative oxidoreductase